MTPEENGVIENRDIIRLLVADDHYIIRAGLIALLQRRSNFRVVAEASDGLEAIQAFEEHHPTVTLMDLRMPNLGGLDAIRQIRTKHPNARILVLTAFDSDEDIYRTLQAGVRGYCLKGAPSNELFEAIEVVATGRRYVPPYISAKMIERINVAQLTEREHEVLSLMATGKSNQQISNSLFISEGTVKTHVNHILTKMNKEDRTAAVISALKRGLITIE